jgi:hypothetical protein
MCVSFLSVLLLEAFIAQINIQRLKGKQFKKGKSIPVRGRGGPYGCETSRLPHFLDNRLADGVVVSPTRRPPFNTRKIPGPHFC